MDKEELEVRSEKWRTIGGKKGFLLKLHLKLSIYYLKLYS